MNHIASVDIDTAPVRDQLFLEFQARNSAFRRHIAKLVGALSAPDSPTPQGISRVVTSFLDQLSSESLNLTLSNHPESANFIFRSWSGLSAILGRLSWMNGARNHGLAQIIEGDDLTTDPNTLSTLAHFRELFPAARACHQILALEKYIQEVFVQWQSGANPEELHQKLLAYYQRFDYGLQTTEKYTDHSLLINNTFEHLHQLFQETPLTPGAKFTIIGPGANPPELKILQKLLDAGDIQPAQIDGIELKTAEALGLTEADFPPDYHFHGGLTLQEWSKLVEADPTRQADAVFFLGSVNNTDPSHLNHLLDMLALARILKPGGLLIYDTASLEDSAKHLSAHQKYLEENPLAAVGAKRSAQFPEFVAHIFPAYLIQLFLDLSNLSTVDHNILQIAPDNLRHSIIARKSGDLPPLAQLLESILTRAYSSPPSSRRPSPTAVATA